MTLKEAKKENLQIFTKSVIDSGGYYPQEADDDLNASNVRVIKAMEEEFGEAWLVKVNLHDEDMIPLVKAVTKGPGYNCYNFCCSMIIPKYDDKLAEMILTRKMAPYSGTNEDSTRVADIFEHAESLGSVHLSWS